MSLLFDFNPDKNEEHEEGPFERLQLCLDGRGWHWQRRLRSVVSAVRHVRTASASSMGMLTNRYRDEAPTPKHILAFELDRE